MSNRGVTVKCVVCGLEVTGRENAEGVVRPSDRIRPAADAGAKPGYCWQHLPEAFPKADAFFARDLRGDDQC